MPLRPEAQAHRSTLRQRDCGGRASKMEPRTCSSSTQHVCLHQAVVGRYHRVLTGCCLAALLRFSTNLLPLSPFIGHVVKLPSSPPPPSHPHRITSLPRPHPTASSDASPPAPPSCLYSTCPLYTRLDLALPSLRSRPLQLTLPPSPAAPRHI